MSNQAILTATPGQTIGPFFGYALPYPGDSELVPPGRAEAIRLHGTVYDGAGQPVPDALVEIWQADADGNVAQVAGSSKRDGFTFTGFGRAAVDAEGRYSFTTVRPVGLTGAAIPDGSSDNSRCPSIPRVSRVSGACTDSVSVCRSNSSSVPARWMPSPSSTPLGK